MQTRCYVFDKIAKNVFGLLLTGICFNIAEEICSAYIDLYNEESSKKIGLEVNIINEESVKRILFEILCFGVFLITIQSPKIIEENKYLKMVPGDESYQYFNENLLFALLNYVEKENISSLYDYDEPLNATKRVDSYMELISKEPGSELKLFGKNIGIAINPPHWPLLDVIGATHAEFLVEATNLIMKTSFETDFIKNLNADDFN